MVPAVRVPRTERVNTFLSFWLDLAVRLIFLKTTDPTRSIGPFSRSAQVHPVFAHARIEKITADSGRLGACFYLSVIQLYDVKSAVTELFTHQYNPLDVI